MISGGQLLGFTAAAMVMIVIPGPGVLFVVGRALSHGRRTALATAAGHAAGNYVVAAKATGYSVAVSGALVLTNSQAMTGVNLVVVAVP